MNTECERCARRAECGVTFEPHDEIGDCGHNDGCDHFEPKPKATLLEQYMRKADVLESALRYIVVTSGKDKTYGDAARIASDALVRAEKIFKEVAK